MMYKGNKQQDLTYNHTRHDHVIPMPKQIQIIPAGRCSNATTNSLDDQAGDVGRHEEDGVELWRNTAERAVQGADGVFQGEVQADADQTGPEDNGDDLDLERVGVPGVGVEEDAGDVACGC